MDEYFDRLKYIKYQGLFNQAANRAFIFEGGVNLRRIFNKMDKNKEKIIKLTRKAEKLSNKYTAGGYEYEEKMRKINSYGSGLKKELNSIMGTDVKIKNENTQKSQQVRLGIRRQKKRSLRC